MCCGMRFSQHNNAKALISTYGWYELLSEMYFSSFDTSLFCCIIYVTLGARSLGLFFYLKYVFFNFQYLGMAICIPDTSFQNNSQGCESDITHVSHQYPSPSVMGITNTSLL